MYYKMLRQTRQIICQIDSQMRQGCRTRSTRLIDINSNLLIQIHITSSLLLAMMFTFPIIFSISDNISFLFIALAQTENNTLSNISMANQQDADNGNNTTAVQILPSWNEGETRETIVSFVNNITNPNSPTYLAPDKRIAVLDNDGTMWAEKPNPFQVYFALERLENLSTTDPSLTQKSPFKEFLQKNVTAPKQELNEKDAMDLMTVTHSNISQEEFNNLVGNWSQSARHPQTEKLFIDMRYQPMIELVNYLKENQFKPFIVSGGGVDFMRESISSLYGIPPEQIIGSSTKLEFVDTNTTKSYIFKEPELNTFNNDVEKPVNIQLQIGKIPIIAVGNSDGDLQMLSYVDDNNQDGRALMVLIHHDDAIREYSYDKGAENVLIEAQNRNWTVVDMKEDFREIYPANETNKNID
jgi:phosphoserine phosphatase